MDIGTPYNAGYLLDQLLRTLARPGSVAEKSLRAGLRTEQLVAIKGFLDDEGQSSPIVHWFRAFDGQRRGAAPLIATTDWRALPATEAMKARRDAELQGKQRVWVPLFEDGTGRIICWPGSDSARLRYLEGNARAKLPALEEVLLAELESLGWKAPADPPGATAPLGELLETLDTLLAESSRELDRPLTFRPGVSRNAVAALARTFDLTTLPEDLALWFQWHDGEDPAPEGYAQRIHTDYLGRVLSTREARERYAELTASEEDVWNESWLPIMTSRLGEVWGYVLSGEHAGKIVCCASPGEAIVRWPSLRDFAHECVQLLQRDLAHPELDVPKDHAISADQKRVLALGGILTHLNNGRHDLLGSERPGVGAVVSHAGLVSSWGLLDAEDVCGQAEALIAPYETLVRDGGEEAPVNDRVAFDLGRVHYIVGAAYVASVIDAERAWSYCLRAARAAQRAYDTWEAFGMAYATHRLADAEDDDDDDEEGETPEERRQRVWYQLSKNDGAKAVSRLLAPGGAWHGLPWSAPIASCPPPILPDPVPTNVRDSDELRAAITAARTGDCIALAPGIYTHQLRLEEKCLRFVALGDGVVWQAEGSESCIMEQGGCFATFEGITFRAPGALALSPGTCARVDDGFFVFRRCRFEAKNHGLVVADDATALVEDCVFLCDEAGVVAEEDAILMMRGCSISGADISGISVEGATVRIRSCRVDQCAGHALFFEGGGGEVHDFTATHSVHSSIVVSGGASVAVRQASLADSGESGVFVHSGGSITLTGVRIERVKVGGVVATGARAVSMRGCVVRSCGENAVLFRDFDEASLSDCELDDTGLAVIAILGKEGSHAEMSDCQVGASREYDSLFVTDCLFDLRTTVFARSARHAISLERTQASITRCELPGAVGTAVQIGDHSEARVRDCTIVDAEDGIWVEAESRAAVLDCEISRCSRMGIVVLSGSRLVASGCRLHTHTNALVFQGGATAVIHQSVVRDTTDAAINFDDSDGLLVDLTLEDVTFGVCLHGGDVEAHRVTVHKTVNAAFEVDADSYLRLFHARVEAPGEAAIFAHAGGRVLAEACQLSGHGEVCCELEGGSSLTLRGSECSAGKKGLFTVDKKSTLVEDKAPPAAKSGWKHTANTQGWSAEHTLPGSKEQGHGLQAKVSAAVDLLAPALRADVFFAVQANALRVATPRRESLVVFEALVTRLFRDKRLRTHVELAAECSRGPRPLLPRAPLVPLMRLLAAVPSNLRPEEARRISLHGWPMKLAPWGIAIIVARHRLASEAAAHFSATRDALDGELGDPEAGSPDVATWRAGGASFQLRLAAVSGAHEVTAEVRDTPFP